MIFAYEPMNYTMNFGAIRICLLFTPPFPHLPLAVALPVRCQTNVALINIKLKLF